MAVTDIDICNVALAAIGEEAIASASLSTISEDNKRTRACKRLYPVERDFLLSRYAFPFAKSRKKLQQLLDYTDFVEDGWYPYAMPSDCMLPLHILPEDTDRQYEVVSGALLCPYPNGVVLVYNKLVENPNRFSSVFSSLLSTILAIRMAPLFNAKTLPSLKQQYKDQLADSLEVHANLDNRHLLPNERAGLDSFVTPENEFTY